MRNPPTSSTNSTGVLILASTVPVGSGDGTPAFVLDLGSALAKQCSVTILAPRISGAPPIDTVSGVTVRRFPYFPRRWEGLADNAIMPTLKAQPWRWIEAPLLIVSMAWHTWRIARKDQFRIINAHWIIPAGLVARMVSRFRGIPYIVTVHGADAYTLNGRVARFIKASVLRNAACTLPVSRDIAQIARSLAGDEAVISEPIPMGVAPVEPSFSDRQSNTFLFVGRLAEKKGIGIALTALTDVPKGELRIIGEGPEQTHLESLVANLELEGRVSFLGRQPRSTVIAEMRSCAALLIPSVVGSDGDTDGTPVVLAEAMSCGTPVLAARIAGLADYVQNEVTGLLVEPGDVDQMSAAMNRMLTDPVLLANLGKETAERFPGSPLDIRETARNYLEHLTRPLT